MKGLFEIAGQRFAAELSTPLDISIPLVFDGPQPNSYDVPPASAHAYEDGKFVGDTRKGGSCNFESYTLIPHCNGTHTECVGHISYERIPVNSIAPPHLFPATLVSITPEAAHESADTCRPEKNPGDIILTASGLQAALRDRQQPFLQGLIIRTLPNSEDKKSRRYMAEPPPYFSIEAMQYVCQLQVEHLLVDLPSVDRTFDEGFLTTHHIFWGVDEKSHDVDPAKCSDKTITEMIFVPDAVPDGRYLVGLQMPNFKADAAPSRPLLFKLTIC